MDWNVSGVKSEEELSLMGLVVIPNGILVIRRNFFVDSNTSLLPMTEIENHTPNVCRRIERLACISLHKQHIGYNKQAINSSNV